MAKYIFFFFFILMNAGTALAQVPPSKPDTLEVDGITIIRDSEADTIVKKERKGWLKKITARTNPKNIQTQWGVVDIGISNYVNTTDHASPEANGYAPGSNAEWMAVKPFKSRNINIWVVMQRINLAHNFLNLKYGLGVELNNYHYKQPIRYEASTPAVTNAPVIFLDNTIGRTYKKNKLAADYITVPVMINFNFTPDRLYAFELSAGISAGYLYSARNKAINSDEGKIKTRGDFDLRPWKLSYIGELNLGVVTLYGSYAFKSMYNRGLHITPYNFGIRLKPMDAFAKIETR